MFCEGVQDNSLQSFPQLGRAREVTPIVLSAVIVMSGLLQWWTELKAEMMMESLQTMSASPKVPQLSGPPRVSGVASAALRRMVGAFRELLGRLFQSVSWGV